MEDSHDNEDKRVVKGLVPLDFSVNLNKGMEELLEADSGIGSVEGLTPVREYTADNLRTMYMLKQYEDVLRLYDCYDHKAEANLDDRIRSTVTSNRVNGYLSAGVSFLAVCLYLKSVKASPMRLDSFINNIYAIPFISIFTYSFIRILHYSRQDRSNRILSKDLQIRNTKGELHTVCVQLTNQLKYPVHTSLV